MSEKLVLPPLLRNPHPWKSAVGLSTAMTTLLLTVVSCCLFAFPWNRLHWSFTTTPAISLVEEQPDGTWLQTRGVRDLRYPGDPFLVLRLGTLRLEWQQNAETAEGFLTRIESLSRRSDRQLTAGDFAGCLETCDLILAQRVPEKIPMLTEAAQEGIAFRSCRLLAGTDDYSGALAREQPFRPLLTATYCGEFVGDPYDHAVELWRQLAASRQPLEVLEQLASGTRSLKVVGCSECASSSRRNCRRSMAEAQLLLAEQYLQQNDALHARIELAKLKGCAEGNRLFIADGDRQLAGDLARLRRLEQHPQP